IQAAGVDLLGRGTGQLRTDRRDQAVCDTDVESVRRRGADDNRAPDEDVEAHLTSLPATAAGSETTEVEVLQTDSWHEALELKAARPEAVPIAGGTDLMVELNFDRVRPDVVLDLTRIPELTDWAPENGRLRVGSGVTYARLISELGDRLPGLAIASR